MRGGRGILHPILNVERSMLDVLNIVFWNNNIDSFEALNRYASKLSLGTRE